MKNLVSRRINKRIKEKIKFVWVYENLSYLGYSLLQLQAFEIIRVIDQFISKTRQISKQ